MMICVVFIFYDLWVNGGEILCMYYVIGLWILNVNVY